MPKSGDEQARTDIEGSDTEKSLRVVNASRLEYLCADGDGRVDWVADDGEMGLWAVLGDSGSQVSDDGGVGLRALSGISVESFGTNTRYSTHVKELRFRQQGKGRRTPHQ